MKEIIDFKIEMRDFIFSMGDVGKALKLISERILNTNYDDYCENETCKPYGCLECKNFGRQEGYNQQRGSFIFQHFKCKKQTDRDMYNHDNTYNIFDIESDCSPYFHYDNAKGECPYFECSENDLVYMSEKEKRKCIGR